MKRMFRSLFVIALVFTTLGGGGRTARAGHFTYTTGFQVQNLEDADASVEVTYYEQDGTATTPASETIPPNDSRTYFPIHPPAGFNGSAVITSNTMVAAVTNILGDSGFTAASYVGSPSGSTRLPLALLMRDFDGFDTWPDMQNIWESAPHAGSLSTEYRVLLPLLMSTCSGYFTWFNVQNTGSGPATVSVAYSDGTAAGPLVIPPGAAHTFDQATESHECVVFSGIVSSDQPIEAVVIEESSEVMFAYRGFTSGSTNPVMPLINIGGGAGYLTGVQIQNAGTVDTEVTVTYIPAIAGTSCSETQTIAAGSSNTFALYAFHDGSYSDCTGGTRFVGSARVTGNTMGQELVAIVNQLIPGRIGEAYAGFDPAVAGDTVVLPLIMDRSGYFTGFNVMNVGEATTLVNCTFTGSNYTVAGTLDPGEALNHIQNGTIAEGYIGSATCTAEAGGSILAVVNELGPSSVFDQLLVYEGIALP